MKTPKVAGSSGTGKCGSSLSLFQLTRSPCTTCNGVPGLTPSISGVNTAGLPSILIDQSGIGVLLLRPIVLDHHPGISSTSPCSLKIRNEGRRPLGGCNNSYRPSVTVLLARLAAILAKHPEVVHSEHTSERKQDAQAVAVRSWRNTDVKSLIARRRRTCLPVVDGCDFSLDNQKTWRHNLQG